MNFGCTTRSQPNGRVGMNLSKQYRCLPRVPLFTTVGENAIFIDIDLTLRFTGNLLLRTGTRKEVEILELRCSNAHRWHDDIHRVTAECVQRVNEAQVEVIHESETAFLGIHWSDGLRLYKSPTRKVQWHKPTAMLSSIDDDNQSNLTLEFKDESKVCISRLCGIFLGLESYLYKKRIRTH